MEEYIVEPDIAILTLKRAKKLVPPEFLWAWEWFSNPDNFLLERLPMGKALPTAAPIKLASQSGIHCPDYNTLPSKGMGAPRYALSIHSSYQGYYADRELVDCGDGTWLFEYHEHERHYGDKGNKQFNPWLINCLNDGIPVAVLLQNKDGSYRNMGLAFVEQYNKVTKTFSLHGPVTASNENAGAFSIIAFAGPTPDEQIITAEVDLTDERVRVKVAQVKRQGQAKFRDALMEAYDKQCALTRVNVPEVLQAAHIHPYRGKNSQLASNGLLLRADIHLLYDAHLLTVEPSVNKIHVSPRLTETIYRIYDHAIIDVPSNPLLRPNDKLLGLHFAQFERAELESA